MALRFVEGRRYRMPVFFGPSAGPRQRPDGGRFACDGAKRFTASATFTTDAAPLEALLPDGFRLTAPHVTFEHTRYRDLDWLAGRGYNTLGVKIPAAFDGEIDRVTGPLLLVLWENMADPIITGREELGFSKLYCELPEPRGYAEKQMFEARWDGHCFFTMDFSGLVEAPPPAPAAADGLLHYRYTPRIGAPGEAETAHAAITPFGAAPVATDRFRTAQAQARFHASTWEQLPTMHHVINTLADLPLHEPVFAGMWDQRGGSDLSEQRPLR